MRKLTCVTLLCCMTILATAADTKEKFKQKVQLSVDFAPGVGYHTYRATAHTPIEGMVTHDIWDKDKVTFGYEAGVNVTWQFHKNIAFEAGVSYMLRGWQWKQDSLWFASYYPNQADSMFSLRATDNFHYINVPLKLKFYAGKGKVKFVGGAGVSLDFLIGTSQTATLIYPYKPSEHDYYKTFPASRNYNFFNASAIASAGIDYSINSRYGIRVEPCFSHQFLKIYKYGTIYGYLWNAGVNCAFYFGVK